MKDNRGQAGALQTIGNAQFQNGNIDEALTYYQASLVKNDLFLPNEGFFGIASREGGKHNEKCTRRNATLFTFFFFFRQSEANWELRKLIVCCSGIEPRAISIAFSFKKAELFKEAFIQDIW